MIYASRISLTILFSLVILSCAPILTSAQEEPLSETIRASIAADAEAQNLTPEEINALITQLAAEAERQGMTADDISWHPKDASTFNDTNTSSGMTTRECRGMPMFLCSLSEAFGFEKGSWKPWLLLMTSMALLFVLGTMMELHKYNMSKNMPKAAPSSTSPGAPSAQSMSSGMDSSDSIYS